MAVESAGCPLACDETGRTKDIIHTAAAKERALNNNVLEERTGLEDRLCKAMLNNPSPTPATSVMFASARDAKMKDPVVLVVPLLLRRGVGGGVDIE